jgi:hypothetical protein
LRRYGVSSVRGDRYSAEWRREAFRKCGIAYEWSELDKSALFSELLPITNSGAIELLDERSPAARVHVHGTCGCGERPGLRAGAEPFIPFHINGEQSERCF